ncbi:MAG: Na+/H+ antiporter NhaA [Cytophagales bacterium]|nr:Na+/H+ antiporter NhaA [Cytophagales bacterium]
MIHKIKKAYKSITLPIQDFLKELEISGLLLLVVTLTALILANSAYSDAFLSFWHKEFEFSFDDIKLKMDFHILINDVLMTMFFIVVGGEIKREILEGALSSRQKAILPIIAALGGMIFPAIIYTIFNFGKDSASGWGIPTATDIAFSLSIISLLGKRVPFALKIFLAALAIADDLGAIIVIAVFYSGNLAWTYLAAGAVMIAVLIIMNSNKVTNLSLYCLSGLILWYLFFMAGIHPTIAGVIFAIAVPYYIPNYDEVFKTNLQEVKHSLNQLANDNLQDKLMRGALIEKMQHMTHKMEAPLHHVLVFLHPITNYIIMPLFAFANAGVQITGDAFSNLWSSISLGIILGLVLGKSTGITLVSWIAVKLSVAALPEGVNWKLFYGMAWLAGIGFTMSIFVTGLAFENKAYTDVAKLAIILGSLVSGVVGYVYLRVVSKISSSG